MKKINKIVLLLIGSFMLGACQQEEYEVLTGENETGFSEGSEFYTQVERASKKDGSADDEIDDSPCFSLRFPFTVELAGVEVKVSSAADLEVVTERIKELGEDKISLQFPVAVTLSNYETVTISGSQEFEELQQSCREDVENGISPITCAKIQFPIKVFVYNINTQQTNSANIANKQQLFTFLQNKETYEVLSFDYPITISYSGDARVVVESGKEFSDALKTCIN
ncbi:hypothetical protein [Salinimicrobium gaetbulicola]|uniref:Lipoprotein n=1 Tax=Salinimicrobium gaetbulicola TaxID=999702 RepID=A0ABW3IHY9_9FLAO